MRAALFFVMVAAVSLGGYLSGRLLGGFLLSGSMGGRGFYAAVFYRPASQYLEIYRLINSSYDYDRMAGYYSLIDNDIIDDSFLMERFRLEKLEPVQRTIIWVLGFSRNRRAVRDFFDGIYKTSTMPIQREIIKSLRRVGHMNRRCMSCHGIGSGLVSDDYIDFIRKNGVGNVLLND